MAYVAMLSIIAGFAVVIAAGDYFGTRYIEKILSGPVDPTKPIVRKIADPDWHLHLADRDHS